MSAYADTSFLVSLYVLDANSAKAAARMKLEELLAQQLSMRLHYRERKGKTAPALGRAGALTAGLLQRLPFRLARHRSDPAQARHPRAGEAAAGLHGE